MSMEPRPLRPCVTEPTSRAAAPIDVPTKAYADLILVRLRRRRQDLDEHNPAVLPRVAIVLSAMHDAGYGQMPAIRADRTARFRNGQVMGERGLQLEDLIAIFHEGPTGQAVALAGLRAMASLMGQALSEPPAGPGAAETAAEVLEDAGRLGAGVTLALVGDGRLDAREAESLTPIAEEMHRDTGRLLTQLAAARAGKRA